VPTLARLIEGRHQIVAVVSQPDRRRGRGRKLSPSPIAELALERGVPLYRPDSAADPAFAAALAEHAIDTGVVVAFGQFLPKRIRELPRRRYLINAHASLLPRHRGAAPIQHAILAGDERTGITVIRIEREMDAGPWCLMRETEILPEETAGELSTRLMTLAAEALLEAVDQIAAGRVEFRPQDSTGVTLASKLAKEFGRIDWCEPCERVLRRIRAATPWPGADLCLRRGQTRLRILEAGGVAGAESPDRPGRVRVEAGRLLVSALDGWIEVRRLQKPGGRAMSVVEYLRGANVSGDEEAESP
jgi:methionyl-tRNA formyltransferase